jgi:hypothetical protein
MANFNTLSEEQIKSDLLTYGYTWLATTPVSPMTMYFEDYTDTVLKLIVDTTSTATVYTSDSINCYIDQTIVLPVTEVTDLQSLDDLLIPLYTDIDPVLIKSERIVSLDDVEILTPTVSTYYTSILYEDSIAATYKISELPSPYRYKEVYWVPVTFLDPEWVLTDNNSVIVDTADVVTNAYGDFIVIKS